MKLFRKKLKPVAYLTRCSTGSWDGTPISWWIARDVWFERIAKAKSKTVCIKRVREAGYVPCVIEE